MTISIVLIQRKNVGRQHSAKNIFLFEPAHFLSQWQSNLGQLFSNCNPHGHEQMKFYDAIQSITIFFQYTIENLFTMIFVHDCEVVFQKKKVRAKINAESAAEARFLAHKRATSYY